MASTFTLKRKLYSAPSRIKLFSDEDNQKSGLSTGAKVGLGALATLGTAAAAFGGAKSGLFGAKAMRSTNMGVQRLGASLKKNGLGKIGESVYQSGKQGVADANYVLRAKNIAKAQQQNLANRAKAAGFDSYKAYQKSGKAGIDSQAAIAQAQKIGERNQLWKEAAQQWQANPII